MGSGSPSFWKTSAFSTRKSADSVSSMPLFSLLPVQHGAHPLQLLVVVALQYPGHAVVQAGDRGLEEGTIHNRVVPTLLIESTEVRLMLGLCADLAKQHSPEDRQN